MKPTALLILALAAIPAASAQPSAQTPLRTRAPMAENWRFHLGETSSPDATITPAYDDTGAGWTTVKIPHDYGLDVPYDHKNAPRGRGFLPPEIGWYRKHFTIPKSDEGKTLQLEFGGIYRNSKIWLNGQYLGTQPGGYVTFFMDITKAANYGADNTLVVRVEPLDREGWWYEGCGIYRQVYYNATSPVHVANHGTYITSTVPDGNKGSAKEAEITIQTTLQNDTPAATTCEVLSEILAPDGTLVATLKDTITLPPAPTARQRPIQNPESKIQNPTTLTQKTTIPSPQLWTISTLGPPNLYQLRTTITQNARPIDTTNTTFGIRTIHFDPDRGFFLNGQRVQIQGAACHNDMPAVGIAMPDSLQPWRVRKLQEMGCNAWRMSHNPPSESLLDACDRLGMLVMAENRHFGNIYPANADPDTTDTDFPDLGAMLLRDRNHPSIIMWSMCNEVKKYQATPEGERLFKAMRDYVRRYDTTRPVTGAMNGGWMAEHSFANVMDLIGVNYAPGRYDDIRKAHPRTPIFVSETAHTKITRGVYADDRKNGWSSSYNILNPKETGAGGVPIATIGWPLIAARPWMAGSFTWVGFDYKGEPTPFGWPQVGNNTGFMDNSGFPKDKYYYQKAWWNPAPMVHLMPMTWNWPGQEGQPIRVVAFSNAQEVELLLNAQSLGKKPMPKNGWVEWQVPYHPGTLTAQAYTDNKLVATDTQETTGKPAALKLTPDRQTLRADNQDTIVIPVSIHDAEGRLVPDATNRVTFHLKGGGRILGTGNGDPSDHDPDRSDNRKTFHAYAIVLIQAGPLPATLELTATSPGLTPAQVTLQTK